jgi:4-hydroxythreonine-4-phosphate dehydrogenase
MVASIARSRVCGNPARRPLKPDRPLRVALTTGEPAGIGPDLSLLLAAKRGLTRGVELTFIGDVAMLEARARRLNLGVTHPVLHIPAAARVRPGVLDVANAPYVLATLDAAIKGALCAEFDAIVTAPVHKGVINDAGIAFTGHTEYLMEKTSAARVVMMLCGSGATPLRVALATTHLALKDVPEALSQTMLEETLAIMAHELRTRFGVARPRIVVAGLNPHAGEGGHMGREEIEIIVPALERARKAGIKVTGPLPADTLFTPRILADADAVLAMYHDQGLPVLKYATFGDGINVTLGLPIIRTSVDHGTALDLARSKASLAKADPGSMIAAFKLACELARGARAKRKATAGPKPT